MEATPQSPDVPEEAKAEAGENKEFKNDLESSNIPIDKEGLQQSIEEFEIVLKDPENISKISLMQEKFELLINEDYEFYTKEAGNLGDLLREKYSSSYCEKVIAYHVLGGSGLSSENLIKNTERVDFEEDSIYRFLNSSKEERNKISEELEKELEE